jgi:hydroxyacid-oxoacid transhydrogenase
MGMGMGIRGLATPIDVGGYNPPPGNTDYAFEVSHPQRKGFEADG